MTHPSRPVVDDPKTLADLTFQQLLALSRLVRGMVPEIDTARDGWYEIKDVVDVVSAQFYGAAVRLARHHEWEGKAQADFITGAENEVRKPAGILAGAADSNAIAEWDAALAIIKAATAMNALDKNYRAAIDAVTDAELTSIAEAIRDAGWWPSWLPTPTTFKDIEDKYAQGGLQVMQELDAKLEKIAQRIRGAPIPVWLGRQADTRLRDE